jgi:hypothetical protein
MSPKKGRRRATVFQRRPWCRELLQRLSSAAPFEQVDLLVEYADRLDSLLPSEREEMDAEITDACREADDARADERA